MFGTGGATTDAQGAPAADRPNAEGVFADVFEEVRDTTSANFISHIHVFSYV